MLKKILLGLLATIIVIAVVVYVSYLNDRADRLQVLADNAQVIETRVGPIEYHYAGDSGPHVLFLHGTPGGYDQSTEIEGFQVITPSRPGYLGTPISAGRTPREQADAYAALLDALEVEKVFVVGASGGGPSTLSFAANYPQRTQAVVAIEAVSQPIGIPEGIPAALQSDFVLWLALSSLTSFAGPQAIVEMMVPDPDNQALILEDPAKSAQVAGLLWSIWPISQRIEGQLNDEVNFAELNLSNEEITVPTLIIHGTKDVNVPFEQSEQLAAQIPHAKLYVIEGADHMMPFSHSEEMEQALEAFMAEIETTL